MELLGHVVKVAQSLKNPMEWVQKCHLGRRPKVKLVL